MEETEIALKRAEITNEMVDRFLKLLGRMGRNVEYQKFVQNLFRILDRFKAKFQEVKEEVQKTTEQDSLMKAWRNAESFMVNFVGQADWDKFKKAWEQVWNEVIKDEETNKFFEDLKEFILDGVYNPESLNTEKKKQQAKELLERARKLSEKPDYHRKINKLNDRARILINNIREDEQTRKFQRNLEKFMRDFALDSHGRPDLWVIDHSLHQLKNILLPVIKEYLEHIPVDSIEISNPRMDVKIENLVFSGANLLPEHMEFKIKSDTEITTKEMAVDYSRTKLKLLM